MNTKIDLPNLLEKIINDLPVGDSLRDMICGVQLKSREGQYTDFESDYATPKIQCVSDLRACNLNDLAQKVISGEFDDD